MDLTKFQPRLIYIYQKQQTEGLYQASRRLLHSFLNLVRGNEKMYDSRFSHFDIKPLNVVVNPTKHVSKYIDFGLAKRWVDVLRAEVPKIAHTFPESDDSYMYDVYPIETCFLRLDFYKLIADWLTTTKPHDIVDQIMYNGPQGPTRRYIHLASLRYIITREDINLLRILMSANMISILEKIKAQPDRDPNILRKMILKYLDTYSLGVTILSSISYIRRLHVDIFDIPYTPQMEDMLNRATLIAYNMSHPILEKRWKPRQARIEYERFVAET